MRHFENFVCERYSKCIILININILALPPLSLPQIEVEEQRRTSRGRAKDSKRKRKSHRGGAGEQAGEKSLDGCESKKSCPLSHSPSPHLPVQPEVKSLPSHVLSLSKIVFIEPVFIF